MNDGDKGLVIQDDLFILIAERNMKGIVPLYYEMESAKGETITNQKIYDSLIAAFKANIGEVSNNITKIFNSSDEIDLEVVKWLAAENNYIIDYAKTLYMPERPEHVEEQIKKAIQGKVPYFFIEAKKKDKKNVAKINKSTVNRLRKVIPNRNIKFEEIAGVFDYKMLMSDEITYVNRDIIKRFKELERDKRRLYRKDPSKEPKDGIQYFFKVVREELYEIEPNTDKVVNSLVMEFFNNTILVNKDTLWNCYGDILLANLRENLKGTKQCESCGTRIVVVNNKIKYCKKCDVEVDRLKAKERMRKIRESVRNKKPLKH